MNTESVSKKPKGNAINTLLCVVFNIHDFAGYGINPYNHSHKSRKCKRCGKKQVTVNGYKWCNVDS